MKVILFGATGMIGKGVLLECLDHPQVEKVLSIGRSKVELHHTRLLQVEHHDFWDFTGVKSLLRGYNACFYCLGVSAAGIKETDYRRITYDFAMAAARSLYKLNPKMTFVYVSGQGTDSSEKSRMMWARVKGKLENDLLALGFKNAVMFRPDLILPKRGIKSRTKSYQLLYNGLGWLLRIIKKLAPNTITDTTRMGQAMINVHLKGTDKTILNPKDINTLAAK